MSLIRFYKLLYLQPRLFWSYAAVAVLFLIGTAFHFMIGVATLIFVLLNIIFIIDIVVLFRNKEGIIGSRITPDKLSNGDYNDLIIFLENNYGFKVSLRIIDEIPFQFQLRDTEFKLSLNSGQEKQIKYQLRPTKRGEYSFGALNVYARSPLGLIAKRYSFDQGKMVPVYPSFLQMRKFELMAISNNLSDLGVKRVRKIGHSMEFEQIKNYVPGDDYRTVNWKASARKREIMVNHYIEERSQQVVSIIDKGRLMRMPFEGLSLLDYAINTSLVISNIAMKKEDKAGLMTFESKFGTFIAPDKKKAQMFKIQEALYNQLTDFGESDFESLLFNVRRRLTQRSLLIIYTNFESLSSMRRQMEYLAAMSKFHVVVVVFFENTELRKLHALPASSMEDIYIKTIGEKFLFEKKQMVKELRQRGVYSIFTAPKMLTVNTINKYLELKARGTI
jgi:uncharacterized protein (DUF58 family)